MKVKILVMDEDNPKWEEREFYSLEVARRFAAQRPDTREVVILDEEKGVMQGAFNFF